VNSYKNVQDAVHEAEADFVFFFWQLINGDATMQYRHPGYERTSNLSIVNRTVSSASRESRWVAEVMEVIDEVPTSVSTHSLYHHSHNASVITCLPVLVSAKCTMDLSIHSCSVE